MLRIFSPFFTHFDEQEQMNPTFEHLFQFFSGLHTDFLDHRAVFTDDDLLLIILFNKNRLIDADSLFVLFPRVCPLVGLAHS